jgi:glycosyltransferase involved in cell wall biosynthesis
VSALEVRGEGGLRRALGIDAAVPLVLHQGAPAPARGCEVLVDAVARLERAHLVFLGDPEPGYDEQLRARIAQLGAIARVSLLPSVSLDELLAYTAEADVGVTLLQDTCENHRLALPNKLFEYIAARVPVVASALPETERLVNDYGVGWCVEPDDPEALARALATALGMRGDAGLQARLARAAGELTWRRERERLIELYRRLECADQAGPS